MVSAFDAAMFWTRMGLVGLVNRIVSAVLAPATSGSAPVPYGWTVQPTPGVNATFSLKTLLLFRLTVSPLTATDAALANVWNGEPDEVPAFEFEPALATK